MSAGLAGGQRGAQQGDGLRAGLKKIIWSMRDTARPEEGNGYPTEMYSDLWAGQIEKLLNGEGA